MSDDPILPTAGDIVSMGVRSILAGRPSLVRHFNNPASRWAQLPVLWGAELEVALARLGDEARSARRRLASGDALRARCTSEDDTTLPTDPQTAVGLVLLTRPAAGAAGVVRQGDQFVKSANPDATPLPVAAATYEAIQAVYVPASATSALVPVRARRPGADANIPIFGSSTTLLTPAKALFDKTLAVTANEMAGGSSGLTDDVLRAAAKAYASGQYAPTDAALVAGALRQQSVRHYALFPAGAVPYAQMYVADESWACGNQWRAAVAQAVADTFAGFGCRTRFGLVVNQQIAVSATIVLGSTDDLNSTSDIDAAVRAAARSYFDDRPDWYRWHLAALQAALSHADRRILHCSAVAVTDPTTGTVVPESGLFGRTWAPTLTHYYLTDNNVTAQYAPPS